MLKKFIFIFTALITCLLPDEPPSWQLFEIDSPNKAYKVKLNVVKKIGKEQRDWKYRLTVYNAKGKKQWSSPYQYDGYPYGDLTNDGQTFVYVNDTYFEDKAVVSIYHKGRYKQEIKGSAFKIVKSTIVSSTSSFMWLGDKRYQLTNDQLLIYTIDGQMFKIVIQDSITKPTN